MTEAVALSSSWVCIYNEHTIAFNPTDRINTTVAVECGSDSLWKDNQQVVIFS